MLLTAGGVVGLWQCDEADAVRWQVDGVTAKGHRRDVRQPLVAGDDLLVLNGQNLVSAANDLVAVGVGRGPLGQTLATAAGDLLIYGGAHRSLRELRWVARSGNTLTRASEPVDAWDLRLSRDGRRVAVLEVPELPIGLDGGYTGWLTAATADTRADSTDRSLPTVTPGED